MSNCCGGEGELAKPGVDKRFRRILWIALALNSAMFAVELSAGLIADSTALLADAVDFMGDAANYALSLFVLALAPAWRSRTALIKGLSMGFYGLFVLRARSCGKPCGNCTPTGSLERRVALASGLPRGPILTCAACRPHPLIFQLDWHF